MDLSLIYIRNNSFVVKSIGDEKVLVPLSNNVADMNKVYNLNEVASFIYDNIDGFKTKKDLLTAVVGKFNVDNDVAMKDLNNFIKEMVDENVLFLRQE